MFKKWIILGLAIYAVSSVRATVTIAANGISNKVLDVNGIVLSAGDLVRLGFFSDPSTLATSNSFSALNSIFTPIGEGILNAGTLTETGNSSNTLDIDNFTGPGSGTFSGTYSGISATYIPADAILYMWIFDSTIPSTANEWGIYQAPEWTFPSDSGTTSMSLSSPNVTAVRGSVNGSNFELSNVPEPASIALIALSLSVGGLWRRLRK